MPEGAVREMLKGGTALKAYLKEHNIRPSELAKECRIDKGYVSQLLNGQRSNPGFGVLLSLAARLGLPMATVQKLLQTTYDSYILQNAPEVQAAQTLQDKFLNYLHEVLDASEDSAISKVSDLTEIIRELDSFPLKACYLCWYEAYILTFQNEFETSIALFQEASEFSPKYEIEKRFKAKVLLGLGTAYMARGQYRNSAQVLRQSLFLWDKGFQVGRVNVNLGTLYRRVGRYELSVDAYEKAYQLGAPTIKLCAISGLIQVALDRKDHSAAREWVVRGYIQAKTTDIQGGKGDLYCNIAEYYLAIGKLCLAEAFFRNTILFEDRSGDLRTKQWAEVELATLFLRKDSVNEFNGLIQRLESELSGHEDVLLIAKHLKAKGRLYFDRKEYLTAITLIEKAYALLPSRISIECKECSEMLYKAYKALHEPKLAAFYLAEMKKHG